MVRINIGVVDGAEFTLCVGLLKGWIWLVKIAQSLFGGFWFESFENIGDVCNDIDNMRLIFEASVLGFADVEEILE